MALWELNTPDMGTDTTCDYCQQVVTSWYGSEDEGKDICVPCLHNGKREGESKKPETYLVTFSITSETDPAEWDWNELMDLNVNESLSIHAIGQITRNNQREAS